MGIIRNLLALIGLLVVIGGGYAYVQYKPLYDEYQPMAAKVWAVGPEKLKAMMETWDFAKLVKLGDALDPKAPEVYRGLLERLMETKNAAAATVWKVPVEEGLSAEDVELSIRNIANEHNIKGVGELPLSEEVQAITGEEQPLLKIYMYCDPLTAMKMVAHDAAYSAYLPCRIALLEDEAGKLWLYAMDMDMMIWGGAPLPPELKEEAMRVRTIILDIMHRAAEGDF